VGFLLTPKSRAGQKPREAHQAARRMAKEQAAANEEICKLEL
jgi:hypothetical protein